jgi:hypothetical protein
MRIKWTYQPKQIKKAAKFIFKKNTSLDESITEIENSIYAMIDDGIKRNERGEEHLFASTGGWTILFFLDDEGYGTIDVLVDPNVSNDYIYKNYKIN